MDEVDVELRQSFLQSKLPGNIPEIVLEREKTAVLVIDVQYMNAHREGKYGRWAREQGIQDQVDWYFSRLEQLTVPSIKALLNSARKTGVQVVYTPLVSWTK